MTAYVILDIEVIDPEGYKDNVNLASQAVQLHGGKYIVRGGQNETLEGTSQAKRLVILEFPSPQYAPARMLRHKYARANMVVVEGVQS